jgi:hypothetical protein
VLVNSKGLVFFVWCTVVNSVVFVMKVLSVISVIKIILVYLNLVFGFRVVIVIKVERTFTDFGLSGFLELLRALLLFRL